MEHSFLTVEESGGDVFADALVMTETGELVFASLWGRDTGIHQLLSMWTIGAAEGGSTSLSLLDGNSASSRFVCSVASASLKKLSGRIRNTILGDLVNTFVFDSRCLSMSNNTRRQWLLEIPGLQSNTDPDCDIWNAVKTTSSVPLREEWKSVVLDLVRKNNWVKELQGFQMSAKLVDMSNLQSVEETISQAVKAGELRIEGVEPTVFVEATPAEYTDPFDGFEVVASYSRAQALKDGVLVDVSEDAREAGFKWPVAVTRTVWDEFVEWDDEDSKRQIRQDVRGRLWDIVFMASMAVRRSPGRSQIEFELYVVPRGGKARKARLTRLKSICGPGDTAEPVITIMMTHED